jgi:hypothetical protein
MVSPLEEAIKRCGGLPISWDRFEVSQMESATVLKRLEQTGLKAKHVGTRIDNRGDKWFRYEVA